MLFLFTCVYNYCNMYLQFDGSLKLPVLYP